MISPAMNIRTFLKAGGLSERFLEDTIAILNRELISVRLLVDESLTDNDFKELGISNDACAAIRKAIDAIKV